MSLSIKEKNPQKNYISFSLIKNVKKKKEEKPKIDNKIKNIKSKISLIDNDIYYPFDKIIKNDNQNTLSTVHKIKKVIDFSKMKNKKIKFKNNMFTNISEVILSLQDNINNEYFYKNKVSVTSRDNIKPKKETIDKEYPSYLTQRQLNNELYRQKNPNSNIEKHISFYTTKKKNDLYFKLMENRYLRDDSSIKYIKASNNGNNNMHLRTECSNKIKNKYIDNFLLLNKKENRTIINHSNNKDKKVIFKKIKKNKINKNNYNIINKFESKNNININKKNDIKTNNTLNKTIPNKQKTLVLDLDETLIFASFEPCSNKDICFEMDLNLNEKKNTNNSLNSLKKSIKTMSKVYLSRRPYLDKFLSELNSYYEICIYSASSKKYALAILDIIDPNKIISKKFFRDDCIYLNNSETFSYIKDLEKFNKNYNDLIIIDDNASSFILQKENGIPIKSWRGDRKDFELLKLIPILKNLSVFYDVRTEIKQFVINNTFIWFQAIKWLWNNCLNYSYIKEMIKIMKVDQIPITNKILEFLLKDENYKTINIHNNLRNSDNKNAFNKTKIYYTPFKIKDNDNNILLNLKKQRLIKRKIKKGKSVNYIKKKEMVNNLNFIKLNFNNNNKNKINKKEYINRYSNNKFKIRSKSWFKKDDNKKYFSNKLIDNMKMKNLNNFRRNNNELNSLKELRRPLYSYYTAISIP